MYTCVIADASAIFREGFQRMLSEHGGFECVFASGSGARALEACVSQQPDFVVIDERLCDQGSLGLVALLSALDPAPLIIGTSLFNEQLAKQRFLAAGASFIPKKLLMSALPEALAELLSAHREKISA